MRNFESVLSRALEILLAILLALIVTIVVTLVVLRYVFNSSITGANELVTILFVYTTAIGAAVAVGRREHIAISFAIDSLPKSTQRMADIIELILIAALNGVMLVYSFKWIGLTGAFLMPSTGLPRAAVQVSVPLGCGLAIIYCLLRLLSPSKDDADADAHEINRDSFQRGTK